MGYRSDVSLTLGKENMAELIRRMKADDGAPEFLKCAKHLDHKNGYESLYWEWVKWYDDYPEVSMVLDFISEVEEKGEDISLKRIGEENDDIEQMWSGDWDVCEQVEVVRELRFNPQDEIAI